MSTQKPECFHFQENLTSLALQTNNTSKINSSSLCQTVESEKLYMANCFSTTATCSKSGTKRGGGWNHTFSTFERNAPNVRFANSTNSHRSMSTAAKKQKQWPSTTVPKGSSDQLLHISNIYYICIIIIIYYPYLFNVFMIAHYHKYWISKDFLLEVSKEKTMHRAGSCTSTTPKSCWA